MSEPRLRVTLQQELEPCSRRSSKRAPIRRALAVEALEQRDPELANGVIEFDDEVDRRYLAIEKDRGAARHHPVAVDLRHVLAILHDNLLHLERMADYT